MAHLERLALTEAAVSLKSYTGADEAKSFHSMSLSPSWHVVEVLPGSLNSLPRMAKSKCSKRFELSSFTGVALCAEKQWGRFS